MKKVLTIIILVSIIGTELLVPFHTARAGLFDDAANWGLWAKEYILDPFAKVLANQLLRRLGNDIINYIQGGGEPRFVQNTGQFVKDAVDAAAGQAIVDITGAGWCQPFRAQLDILLNRTYFPEQTFNERVACTATEIFDDFQRFRDDFRNGGWATWIQLHETRNTLLGASLIADDEAVRALTAQRKAVEEEIRLGQGYLGQKTCSSVILNYGPGGTETVDVLSVTGKSEILTDSKEWTALVRKLKGRTQRLPNGLPGYAVQNVRCAPGAGRIVTPGNLIGDQVSKAIGKDIAGLIAADELGEVVGAIIDALINRGVREGLALMKTGRGSQTTPHYGTYTAQATTRTRQQPTTLGLEGAAATELLNRVLKVQTDLQFLMHDTDELIGREYAVSQFESYLQQLRNLELGCRTRGDVTTVGELVERCLFPPQFNERILTPGPYYTNRSLSQAMVPLWEELLGRFDSIIAKVNKITTTPYPFCSASQPLLGWGEIPNLRFTLAPQERNVKNPTSLPITDNKGTIFSYPFPTATSTEYLSVFYQMVGTVDPLSGFRSCPDSPNLGIGLRTCYAGSFGLIWEIQTYLELRGTQQTIAELNRARQNVETYTARIAATKERLESLNEELKTVNETISTLTLYATVLTDYDRAGRETNLVAVIRAYNEALLISGSENELAAAYLDLLAAEQATRAGWRQIQLDVLADSAASEFAKNRAQEKLTIIDKAIALIESSLKPPAQAPATSGASGSIKGGLSGLSLSRIGTLAEGIKSGTIKLSDVEKELNIDVFDPTRLGLSSSAAVAQVLGIKINTLENEMALREAKIAGEKSEVANLLGEFLIDPEERNRVAITGKGGEWGKYFQLRYDLTYLFIINDAYQSLEREIDKIGVSCGL